LIAKERKRPVFFSFQVSRRNPARSKVKRIAIPGSSLYPSRCEEERAWMHAADIERGLEEENTMFSTGRQVLLLLNRYKNPLNEGFCILNPCRQCSVDVLIYYVYTLIAGGRNMKTVVQKWGNSLGIRIPAVFTREFNLKNGSSVEIIEEKGRIVISPKKQTLEELLSFVTDKNIHNAVETGSSIGKEEW